MIQHRITATIGSKLRRPPRGFARPLGVVLVLCLAPTLLACGTSCPEIRAERQQYAARTRTTGGPDARLSLPFSLIDRVVVGQLARRPAVPIKLPTDRIGLATSLSIALDRISAHAADAGRLGFTLHVALLDASTNSRVLELDIDTSIAPRLETRASRKPELVLLLRPQDIGAVRPRTTPEGTRLLADWLRERLPTFARAFATDKIVDALAQESLELIAKEVWPHAKDRVLGTEALIDSRITLPDLPVRELALSSSARALVLHVTTDLPDSAPIGDAYDRVTDRMVLRLSGGTAVGLVNRAMDRGDAPSRFDEAGKPDQDGVWEARVGWQGGATPLVVHLWRTSGACKRAEVAARLSLALRGDTVRVDVHDGRLTSLAGPAFAQAFAWLEQIFGDALTFTFDTDAFVRFEAGDDQVQVRLAKIALGAVDLVLDLDLGVAPR